MLMTKNSGLPLEAKAVSDAGVIEGYASVFGNVDSYGEVVEPGAFADSLVKNQRTGRKVKMLYQHDPHQPIGVWDDLAEDGKGLWVRGRLLVDQSPKAREVHGLLKEGALDGLSIGYRTVKAEPKEGKPGIVSLVKLDLLENSIVTFAANERARVEVVKSMIDAGAVPPIDEFDKLLREAGFSKTQRSVIAGKGYLHLLRSESGTADQQADFVKRLHAALVG
jgi:HK97 family phage prohead protease